MSFELVVTEKAAAEEIMAKDVALLTSLVSAPRPILHFYNWAGDSATFGHFIAPFDYLRPEAVARRSLALARRPTGGGILFHLTDLAFSVLIPANHPGYSSNILDNYAYINRHMIEAISLFRRDTLPTLLPDPPALLNCACRHFCMAQPTKFDLMLEGRKVGGAAQRRTRFGFLHQGTISLSLLPEEYLHDLIQPKMSIVEAMRQHTHALLGSEVTKKQLAEARSELKHLIFRTFQ